MPDDLAIIAATTRDLAAADAAFERLVRANCGSLKYVDAVTIGKNLAADVRFDREAEALGRSSPVSLAAGVAAALYPSVVADLPASRAAQRAELSALAGRIAYDAGRAALRELGEYLDAASAALIVVAPAASAAEIVGILGDDEGAVIVRAVSVDVDDIARATHLARKSSQPPIVEP